MSGRRRLIVVPMPSALRTAIEDIQGQRIAGIHLHRFEQAARALSTEPTVQALGEAAEMPILTIAEGKEAVKKAEQSATAARTSAKAGSKAVKDAADKLG